jgi:SnoaL-like domain
MTREQAHRFAAGRLLAWTGNDPKKLAAFYTDDLFYSDPTVPNGIEGKPAFLRYLSKLLADNPACVWTQEGAIPMEGGFLNKWKLDAPVGDGNVTCHGVCTVEFRAALICRNQVYFGTLPLISAIESWNRRKRVENR